MTFQNPHVLILSLGVLGLLWGAGLYLTAKASIALMTWRRQLLPKCLKCGDPFLFDKRGVVCIACGTEPVTSETEKAGSKDE